jgi:hypothetical protein
LPTLNTKIPPPLSVNVDEAGKSGAPVTKDRDKRNRCLG